MKEKKKEFIVIGENGLFAGGIDQVCDLTIAVTASVETRVQRIMHRDGISLLLP